MWSIDIMRALVLAESLHIIKQAEKDGFDAAVMGCFYDPGLHDAREIVEDMVITAPAETCMHSGGYNGT